MLTQKTRYSMLALVKLSQEYGNGPISIHQIAESEMIPKRFLESILLELKKSGYLSSNLGKNGGYFLIKDPKQISLLEIIQLFEGSIAWLACTSERYYQPCEHRKDERLCKIHNTFKDIRRYTFEKLAGVNFDALAADMVACKEKDNCFSKVISTSEYSL